MKINSEFVIQYYDIYEQEWKDSYFTPSSKPFSTHGGKMKKEFKRQSKFCPKKEIRMISRVTTVDEVVVLENE